MRPTRRNNPQKNPTIMYQQNHCIYINRQKRALQGRHPFIAQGASPGLVIETNLLSPVGAELSFNLGDMAVATFK